MRVVREFSISLCRVIKSEIKVASCRDRRAHKVVKEISRRIVKANSFEVDGVSGATPRSRAINGVVRKAMKEALRCNLFSVRGADILVCDSW